MDNLTILSNKINEIHSVICLNANHENNFNDSSTINNTMNRLPSYSDILCINTNTSTSNTSNKC